MPLLDFELMEIGDKRPISNFLRLSVIVQYSHVFYFLNIILS
jgi:hypothetical protein